MSGPAPDTPMDGWIIVLFFTYTTTKQRQQLVKDISAEFGPMYTGENQSMCYLVVPVGDEDAAIERARKHDKIVNVAQRRYT